MADDTHETNGWNEWSRYVLAELERLDENGSDLLKRIDTCKDETNKKLDDKFTALMKEIQNSKDVFVEKLDSVREQVITLKVKVAMIGGLAGLIMSGAITLLIHLLTKGN